MTREEFFELRAKAEFLKHHDVVVAPGAAEGAALSSRPRLRERPVRQHTRARLCAGVYGHEKDATRSSK